MSGSTVTEGHPRGGGTARALFAGAIAAVLLVAACTPAAPGGSGPALTKVRALIPSDRKIDFFPMLIAEELGYYREEGLDVRWEATDGSSFVVQQLIAGSADVGAALAGPTLLGAAESPGTLKSVYDAYSNTNGHIYDTWAIEGGGVTSLADLKDKKLGVKDMSGGEIPEVRVALSKIGLAEGTDVELLPVGESPAAQADALISGRVDAMAVIVFGLTPLREALEKEGKNLICITCNPDSVLTSMTVSVRSAFAKEKPEAVGAIGRSIAKAMVFAQTNPDAALAVMKKINPAEQADLELAKRVMANAIKTWEPEPEPANRNNFGLQNMDGWKNVMDVLLAPGTSSGLEAAIDLTTLVDTSYVSKFNDFDRSEVANEANGYKP